MKKRFLLTLVVTILFTSIAISSFAMDNVVNGIRNAVGGAENTIENIGSDVAGGIRNGFNTLQNGAENVSDDVRNGMHDAENTTGNAVMGTVNNNNNNGYTATRTSTDEMKITGMTTNTWSWIIMGITAAAIVILVWSYIKQKNKNDIYIDSDEL